MSSIPTQNVTASSIGIRRRKLALAVVVAALTIAWLAATADKHSTEPHQVFGLWRMRHIAIAVIGMWFATVALAAAVSRKALMGVFAATFSAAMTVVLVELVGLTGIIDVDRVLRGQSVNPYGTERVAHLDVTGATYQDIWTRWGVGSQPMPFHFKTDSRGFRNEQDRKEANIYLLGDSFLVAGMLPFEKTITHLLETATKRPVMGVALIGLSVQAERDMFCGLDLALKGRLVLHFVFEGNDLLDSAAYREKQSGKRVLHRSWRDRSLTYQLLMELQRKTETVDPLFSKQTGYLGDDAYGFMFVGPLVHGHDEEIPHVLAALDDTRRFVEAHGGAYAIVAIPDKFRVLGPFCRWPPGSKLTDAQSNLSPLLPAVVRDAAERGVPVLDLTAALQEPAKAGRITFFPGDTHWNENGHAAGAEAIAAWIPTLNWKSPANDSDKGN